MIIHFKKDTERRFILHCIRDNGTETYQKYDWGVFQIEHDLMHYVIETTLKYRNAFYGIIASGKDISWFTEREGNNKTHKVSDEAMNVEILVGALQTLRNDDDFWELAPSLWKESTMPNYNKEQIASIREKVSQLVHEWQSSDAGITLEFN
jgi:hypothetical protein